MRASTFTLIMLFNSLLIGQTQHTYSYDTLLMGSAFVFKAVSSSPREGRKAINAAVAEVVRIEQLISSWDANSQTYRINQNAGIAPVKVEKELYDLIKRSLKVSVLTDGYFDISYASLDKVWDFSKTYTTPPDEALIKASVKKIDYQKIVLNDSDTSVYLLKKGMKIGFGAIGKGYAANRAKAILEQNGIKAGVVNAGGDLISWGLNSSGKEWTVGIADPNNEGQVLMWLDASDLAVVTSGDYQRYVLIEGKRYAHIINPRTGWPVQGIKSVTILCPDAELADALATSVFVLGKQRGLKLINQLNGIDCLIIDDNNDLHYSAKLQLNIVNKP